MIKEAIEKARAYSDNKDKIDAYYDGYAACYLELNKQLKAEHTRGEIDFVNMNCNSTCKKVAELEAQIEKMKCCGNCVYFDFTEPNYCHKGVYRANQNVCGEWCFGN